MEINSVIHGFKINNIRHLDEINADMYEMVHEKTKARLIWLKRDDENKTFSIGFKTTPVDDTGVFHILEHSVLNGSRRYPVREPFVDLLKGSLQTFLNAMTFPDKTVYPISSRNNKDFINLMRVYLDAVFYPNVLNNPNVFYQEGWHYELNDLNEEPIYKGVVFNEMKGAFSSADSVKSRVMMHSLFPDNCYGNESGGDPDYITDLTYEQFCAAHKKYYNPSNSYIFLDGDLNIDEVLGIINDEYLSDFNSDGDVIEINKQKQVEAEDVVREFEIAANQSKEGKAHISYGYVLGDFDEYEKIMAFSLISSVLCGNNESPLKKIILNNNLAEDISFDIQDGILQPFAVIDLVNTDLDKEELINKTISEELERIVKEGLNKEELEANLNQREFKAKERDYGGMPKGLVYGLGALDSWLYGGDPKGSICYGNLFDSLREKINSSYYEDLIRDYILNSKHHAKVLLEPSNTLGERKLEKEKNKLKERFNKFSEEDKKNLIEMNKKLQLWQASEDTPEQKATLPYLHLEDLKKEPTEYKVEAGKYNDNTVLNHNDDTNGISYVSLYLKANDFSLKEYTVMLQMLVLLGKLKTENYDVLTLNRKMKSILGDFVCNLSPLSSYKDGSIKTVVSVNWSSLHRNDSEAVELIKEIIYRTDYSDKQAIRDILKQNIFTMEQSFIHSAHSLAVQRASSYDSKIAIISENASGYEAYKYLKNLDDNWDELADGFIDKLKEISERLFIKERYTVSVASDDKQFIVESIMKDAPSSQIGEDIDNKPLGHKREGIIVPSNVSYAAKCGMLTDETKNIGVLYVLSNILSYDYFWNNIRVKNGAYGCGMRSGYNKRISMYSYRDPNPNNSLSVFENTTEYLKSFIRNNNSVENYIVGTTGDFDPLLSLKASIRLSDLEYILGLSYDDKKRILKEILDTDIKDIEESIGLFERLNELDNVCVIGNAESVRACKDKLDEIFEFNK